MESFPILRFLEVPFRNLSIYWSINNLNDVTKRFCAVTTLTWHFMIQYQKTNLCTKF